MTGRRLDAVLFDLHGVVTSSPWAALAEVGTAGGVDADTVLRLMLGDYAEDGDHPWHRLERGEIPLDEYGRSLVAAATEAGIALDFSRLRGFNDRVLVNDRVVARARSLRQDGYRTALVTNNVRELAGGWRALVPADELFDVVVDSSDVGVRKPNPAIFLLALERLGGIEPGRAVFLDDAPGNVEGARRAGLHAILVDDADVALAELDRLLEAAPSEQ
ncbi:MAG TPA: HAD family phosphatase [Acidimicrobiales bacterium]